MDFCASLAQNLWKRCMMCTSLILVQQNMNKPPGRRCFRADTSKICLTHKIDSTVIDQWKSKCSKFFREMIFAPSTGGLSKAAKVKRLDHHVAQPNPNGFRFRNRACNWQRISLLPNHGAGTLL